MQLINKTSIKKTFFHTWYLYPILAVILTLLWLWLFPTFHQPTTHQKINVFFATEVKSGAFTKSIEKQYEREKLRQVDYSYCLPTSIGFPNKLQIGINKADILILDETTMSSFNGHQENFFVEITSFIKDNYLEGGENFYTDNEKDYGILLKQKDADYWLKQYMDFDETRDYYLALSIGSKNLGSISGEDNKDYDNALTIIKYLLKEH